MAQDTRKPKLELAPHQIIVRPLVTEKGMHKATRCNAYAFEVNRMAGKDDVRRAVEALFDVKVVAVRTQNRQGKPRRSRNAQGATKTLEKGHRHLGPRASDRLLLRACASRITMGIRRIQSDQPGTPRSDRQRLCRPDAGRQAGQGPAAAEAAARAAATTRAKSPPGIAAADTSGTTA